MSKFQNRPKTGELARAAVTAALYVALTVTPPLSALSFGAVQLRLSEALCVLPFFFPETGIGLVLGCLISNFFSPNILPLDIVLGTAATAIAVCLTLLLRTLPLRGKVWLVPLPTVLANALIVPLIICFSVLDAGFAATYVSALLTVGLGEILSAYGLGLPLCFLMQKFHRRLNIHKEDPQ